MAAMVIVDQVLGRLADLLVGEAKLLGGVRGGIEELRDDLESMKSFLQDAEARGDIDQGIRTWVEQVREVSYDAEDVVEDFSAQLTQPHGHGFFHSLRKVYHHIRKLRKRHHLAVQIQNIKKRIKSISERRNAFSLRQVAEGDSSNARLQGGHDPRMASLFIDEADVVGIQNPKSLLINWLIGGEQKLTSISVVGMGGLGKTTLVKKVYDSHSVKKHFNCYTWVAVSKSFTVVGLLQAAFKGFLEATKQPVPGGLDTMGDVELIHKLKSFLHQKRYVIVLDDIWSVNAWEAVKFAFPDCDCGSRIIFTTRIGDIADSIETHGHVYYLRPLQEEEAWTLFCMKAFRREPNGICPAELEDMSQNILKKCGGLPLAIVTIGSLLARKNKLISEWKKVHENLATEMKSNSSLKSLERILLLSYKDLPYHLKCCYLYLIVFPEDYLIKRMKLIRLWVVERFVEEKPGLTMEQVAEEYLNELVGRSLIQAVQMDYFNRVRTCQIHDLMREVIGLKSTDESFVTVMNERNLTLHEKVRRLAIHENSMDFQSAMRLPSLRSLLVFASVGSPMSFGSPFFSGFRMLRVLELESAPIFQFPTELVGMIHLRYLSLRRTVIKELPDSIGKLKNLEILDLNYSLITSIPESVLQLEHLYQLRNYHYHSESSSIYPYTFGMSVPTGIGRLTNLQKLGNIEVNGDGNLLRELGKLTQLRRLGVLGLRQEDELDLCSSLEMMKQLTSLYMVSKGTTEELKLDSLLSPPKFLQRLFLKCSIQSLPEWIVSLQFLGKLVLQYSNLQHDPLKTLQDLPSLVVLELRDNAYGGEELCCNAQGYQRLKRLLLHQLKQLKYIRVGEGAMPRIRDLYILSCEKLEAVPMGIEHLKDLEDLGIWYMPRGFYDKIRPNGDDFWKVQHISTINGFDLQFRIY